MPQARVPLSIHSPSGLLAILAIGLVDLRVGSQRRQFAQVRPSFDCCGRGLCAGEPAEKDVSSECSQKPRAVVVRSSHVPKPHASIDRVHIGVRRGRRSHLTAQQRAAAAEGIAAPSAARRRRVRCVCVVYAACRACRSSGAAASHGMPAHPRCVCRARLNRQSGRRTNGYTVRCDAAHVGSQLIAREGFTVP